MEQNGAFFFLNPEASMYRTERIGVTFCEILWMLDHHYHYRISTQNPLETVFEPSSRTPNTTTMVDYFPNSWTPANWQTSVINRLSQVMQHINEEREAFQNQQQKRMGFF
jgi:hypothetical protein